MTFVEEDLESFARRKIPTLQGQEAAMLAAVRAALRRFGRNEWAAPILDAGERIFRQSFREATGTNKSDRMDSEVAQFREELRRALFPPGWAPVEGSDQRIATAAAQSAHNAGLQFGYRDGDDGQVMLVWTTMHDNRVRRSHELTDGQARRPGQQYLVGPDAGGRFARMRFPGDPRAPISFWINERCVLRPTRSRIAAMSASATTDPEPQADRDIEDLMDGMAQPELDPTPWHGVLVVEGIDTGDRRRFAQDSLQWPELPIPLSWQKINGDQHQGSVVVGRIDQIRRDGPQVLASGVFADTPEADEVIGLIAENFLKGISIDVDSHQLRKFASADGGPDLVEFTEARIRSATLVAIPAYVEAYLSLGAEEGALVAAISEGSWDGSASRFTLEQWKRACLLDTGEGAPFMKSRYKLPIREPDGKLSRAGVHAAAGRLNQTDAGAEEIAKAKRALRSAYRELKEEPPESIAASAFHGRGPGFPTVPGQRIWRHWTKPGEAGFLKIGWGRPGGGDFARCKRHLSKYISPRFLNRTCSVWHHDALGVWPGQEHGGRRGRRGHFADDGCKDCDMDLLTLNGMAATTSDSFTVTTTPEPEPDPEPEALAASADTVTHRADFFRDPQLLMESPLVVTREGRVFGHLASWKSCHLGVGDSCVVAPHSRTGYSYFKLGSVLTEEGEIPTGKITLGGGHATLDKGFRAATEHYDSTSAVVADVTVGEDEFGIWFAGQLRPDATDAQIAALRAAPLSGDWRKIGGGLELVAALAVNTPGFMIPRAAVTASGDALIAAGVLDPGDGGVALIAAAVADEMEARDKSRRMSSLRQTRNRERMDALRAH